MLACVWHCASLRQTCAPVCERAAESVSECSRARARQSVLVCRVAISEATFTKSFAQRNLRIPATFTSRPLSFGRASRNYCTSSHRVRSLPFPTAKCQCLSDRVPDVAHRTSRACSRTSNEKPNTRYSLRVYLAIFHQRELCKFCGSELGSPCFAFAHE